MALKTDAYYRGLAAKALADSGCSEPPIPVEAIVSSYGIPIRSVSLPQFFTAATVYEDGLPVMVVNWAKTEFERRAAMAHMLGHILLVLDDPSSGYARAAYDHDDADIVARELVMPIEMVIEQARLWFNDYRYLARLFGVSEEDMMARMRGLGLIKGPDGVVWDY
jgi:Zn-dependent peptidase ImmA (M78 family)